mmetsp:Transcript_7259/g.12184  ORF Transcript_7259/g.12184 Transcript_7259/m.12184 type:complete len:560 (-) Transcript_7259:230-1909(-)
MDKLGLTLGARALYQPPSWLSAASLSPDLIPQERLYLGRFPTPVHSFNIPGIPEELGFECHIKRDDLSSFDLSGNKVRKLEFLLAEATKPGARYDSVITIGGIQSNHCRATAVAARQLGLDPFLILRKPLNKDASEEEPDVGLTGNLLWNRMIGADIRLVSPATYAMVGSDALCEQLADQLQAEGRHPYVIPVGGSNAVGAFGYMQFVEELIQTMGSTSPTGAGAGAGDAEVSSSRDGHGDIASAAVSHNTSVDMDVRATIADREVHDATATSSQNLNEDGGVDRLVAPTFPAATHTTSAEPNQPESLCVNAVTTSTTTVPGTTAATTSTAAAAAVDVRYCPYEDDGKNHDSPYTTIEGFKMTPDMLAVGTASTSNTESNKKGKSGLKGTTKSELSEQMYQQQQYEFHQQYVPLKMLYDGEEGELDVDTAAASSPTAARSAGAAAAADSETYAADAKILSPNIAKTLRFDEYYEGDKKASTASIPTNADVPTAGSSNHHEFKGEDQGTAPAPSDISTKEPILTAMDKFEYGHQNDPNGDFCTGNPARNMDLKYDEGKES